MKEAQNAYFQLKTLLRKNRINARISFSGHILNDSERVYISIQKRIPLILLNRECMVSQGVRKLAYKIIRQKKTGEQTPVLPKIFWEAGQ
jgi:hypothetical protein